jgi:hypothetical protein
MIQAIRIPFARHVDRLGNFASKVNYDNPIAFSCKAFEEGPRHSLAIKTEAQNFRKSQTLNDFGGLGRLKERTVPIQPN